MSGNGRYADVGFSDLIPIVFLLKQNIFGWLNLFFDEGVTH